MMRTRAAMAALTAASLALQGCLGLRIDDGRVPAGPAVSKAAQTEWMTIIEEFMIVYSCMCGKRLPVSPAFAGGKDAAAALGGLLAALGKPEVSAKVVSGPESVPGPDGSSRIAAVVEHSWKGKYNGADVSFEGKTRLTFDRDGNLLAEEVVSGNPLFAFQREGGSVVLDDVSSAGKGKTRVLDTLSVAVEPGPTAFMRFGPEAPLPGGAPSRGKSREDVLKEAVAGALSSPSPRVCSGYEDGRARNAAGLADSIRQQSRFIPLLDVRPTNVYIQEDSGGKVLALVTAAVTARFRDGRRYQEIGRYELAFCSDDQGLSLLSQAGTNPLVGWVDGDGTTIERSGTGVLDGADWRDLRAVNGAVQGAAGAAAGAAPGAPAVPAGPGPVNVTLVSILCKAGVLTANWRVDNTGPAPFAGNLRFGSLGTLNGGAPIPFNQAGTSAAGPIAVAGNAVIVATYVGAFLVLDNIVLGAGFGGDPSEQPAAGSVVTLLGGYPKATGCVP